MSVVVEGLRAEMAISNWLSRGPRQINLAGLSAIPVGSPAMYMGVKGGKTSHVRAVRPGFNQIL